MTADEGNIPLLLSSAWVAAEEDEAAEEGGGEDASAANADVDGSLALLTRESDEDADATADAVGRGFAAAMAVKSVRNPPTMEKERERAAVGGFSLDFLSIGSRRVLRPLEVFFPLSRNNSTKKISPLLSLFQKI